VGDLKPPVQLHANASAVRLVPLFSRMPVFKAFIAPLDIHSYIPMLNSQTSLDTFNFPTIDREDYFTNSKLGYCAYSKDPLESKL